MPRDRESVKPRLADQHGDGATPQWRRLVCILVDGPD